jgi:hypothetical protein
VSIADQIKGHSCGLEEYQPGETRYYTIEDDDFRESCAPTIGRILTPKGMPREKSLMAHPSMADLFAVMGIKDGTKFPNIAVMTKDQLDFKANRENIPQVVVIEYDSETRLAYVIDWWTVKA